MPGPPLRGRPPNPAPHPSCHFTDALGRGITVLGAASIGALRAAELDTLGMVGIGAVYTAYARGEITGDDEVAVGQAPDGGHRALTWPLVNLRHALDLARADGVLDTARADSLLQALRAVFYAHRTPAAVRAVCRAHGETVFSEWLEARCADDVHFADLKRADALTAVSAALNGLPSDRPVPRVPVTPYVGRWSNAAALSTVGGMTLRTEDRLLYQQIFDPGFAGRWKAYLEQRSLLPAGGAPGRPLHVRLTATTGGDLPAHHVFRPTVDLRDPDGHAAAGRGECAGPSRGRPLHGCTRPRPGLAARFTVAAVRDDITRRLLREAWRCPDDDLDMEASARGLQSAARAVTAAKRLVPGVLEEQSEMSERAEAGRVGR